MTYEQTYREEIKAIRARLRGPQQNGTNIIGVVRANQKRLLLEQVRRDEEKAERAKAHQEKMRLYREAAAARKKMNDLADVRKITTSGYATVTMTTEYETAVLIGSFSCAKPSMESIAITVLDRHPGVTLDEVKSADRHRNIMMARREIIATVHKIRPDISFPRLGRFVGKDHTTVMHAIRRYAEQGLIK